MTETKMEIKVNELPPTDEKLNNNHSNELTLLYCSSISYDESETRETRNESENNTDNSLDELCETMSNYLTEIRAFCLSLKELDEEKREAFFYDKELGSRLDYIRSKTYASFLNSEERVVCVVDKIVNSELPTLYFAFLEYLNFTNEVVSNSRCRKVTNFIKCQTIIWNITDKSTELCSRLLQDGLSPKLFPILSKVSKTENCLETTNVRLFTKGILGVLYNVVQKIPSARGLFRLQHGVKILRLFVNQTHVAIKTGCLLLLSHIVDEFENNFINATDDNICYVLNIFAECGKSQTRHSKEFGYHGLEMLQGLKAIASQDRNKEKLVRNDALIILEEYITSHCETWSQDEELAVYEFLWSLAYDDICRKSIVNRPVLMKMMTDASENGRSVLIRRSASGALWKVHDIFGKRQRKHSHLSTGTLQSPLRSRPSSELLVEIIEDDGEFSCHSAGEEVASDDILLDGLLDDEDVVDSALDGDADDLPCQIKREHIFISYSHTTQKMMLRVRDYLREEGYNVWMDVDYMVGSTIESMATAVEGAALVMFGMCQRFKDSPHCRAELEYAYRLQKPMLPLVMEADFKADGWLGFLCGSKLTYDLFEEEHVEKNFPCILKELGGRGKPSCSEGICISKICQQTSSIGTTNDPSSNTFSSCKASCCKEASTDTMDGLPADNTGIWMRQESSNHNPASVPRELLSSSTTDIPMTGCLGCGRYKGYMPRLSTNCSFNAWTSAEVSSWLETIGLKDCAEKLSGVNGELLMEWQRMRCIAPDFFYRIAHEELKLSLIDLLKLTHGMTRLCEQSTETVMK